MNHPPPPAVSSSSSSPFQTKRGGASSNNDGNKLVEVIEVDEDHDSNITIYEKEAKNLFHAVVTVATINMLINTFRPDDAIAWPLRLPRILWELSLAIVAKSATSKRNRKRTVDKSQQSSHSSPSILLLLATMLITTGITDIFVWAPLFSAFVQFKTCTGGFFTGEPYKCSTDHIKGYGRVVAVVQSLMGGLLYLLSGIAAYNAYSDVSYQRKLNRQVHMMEHMNRVEREQRQLLIKQQQKQQEGQQQHDAFDNLWKLFFNTV